MENSVEKTYSFKIIVDILYGLTFSTLLFITLLDNLLRGTMKTESSRETDCKLCSISCAIERMDSVLEELGLDSFRCIDATINATITEQKI